ncbi:beta-glucosidase [Ranunculus cassubicifolius]
MYNQYLTLPKFTANDLKQITGSFDVQDLPRTSDAYRSDYLRDISAKLSFPNGMPFATHGQEFTRLKADGTVNERGLQQVLDYVKVKYKNHAAVIHENGISPSLNFQIYNASPFIILDS